MQHFFLGIDAAGIAQAPFTPGFTDGMVLPAAQVGLPMHPEARLYVMPSRSGYIGGDLVAAIVASGAAEQQHRVALGLDLGTNGEIFLGHGGRMLTCSAAAGPALEGARISRGMIARAGAIEGVVADGRQLRYRIIGNTPPRGLCGSGLVDLVAALLDCGVIDPSGRILSADRISAPELAARIVADGTVNHFRVATAEESHDGRPLDLSQKDVRELQLAKGAIAAGIETLLDRMGIAMEAVATVYLAGALGNYINPASARRIGLLPPIDPQRVVPIGNAAGTGATMVLLSCRYWQMSTQIARRLEHVELSTRPDFNQRFVGQLAFPDAPTR